MTESEVAGSMIGNFAIFIGILVALVYVRVGVLKQGRRGECINTLQLRD